MQKAILTALISLLAISGIALMYTDNSVTLKLSNDKFLSNDKDVYQQYTAWKQLHGKNTNGSEDELRFTIFKQNLDFINKNNQQNSDLTLGLTKFADLTNAEFRSLMTVEIIEDNETKTFANIQSNGDFQDVDWVSKGAVTGVKNQGSCGSCWAFSATGGLEGLNQINNGTLESFSEQQLTDCVPLPFSFGCKGGNPGFAYMYTAQKGIETEQDYPYVSGTSGKKTKCQYESDKVAFQNTSAELVKPNSPQDMNAQLQKQPLSIAVDAGSIYFQLYNDGVLKSENCGIQLNHAITLVGYVSSSNSWTVKNSWGTGWGNKGYAQILNTEGNGICGINMQPSFPTL